MLGDYLKNYLKGTIKRYILRYLITNPYFWMAVIFLGLISLGAFTALGIFGAAYGDNTVAANGRTVQQMMPVLNPPVLSSDKMEEQFFLPWAVPYALQLYARDWDDTLDEDMVRAIVNDLNPRFQYIDYTKVVKHWEKRWNEEQKQWVTYYWEDKIPEKFITVADTYAGVYVLRYKEVTRTYDSEGETYKRHIEVTDLERVWIDFYPDWTRLDMAIAKYVYNNNKEENIFDVKEYDVKASSMTKPFDGNYPVTSPFGMREDPMNPGSREFHPGIDFGVPSGTPIKAAADGVVTVAGSYGGYGNAVMINHGNGTVTLYGHLSEIKVEEGKEVKQGDVIGLSGNTGRSTGPHLHFEIRENGQPVDPSLYIAGIKTFSGGEVYYIAELNRKMLLETAASFMENKENIEWLLDSSDYSMGTGVPPWQKYDVKPGEIPNELIPVFKAAGDKYGIPWTVLAAIACRESSFNPNAVGPYLPDYNTSAVGMMQFLPETFKAYGVDGNGDGIISPFDPSDAVYTAAHYLSSNYNLYKKQGYSDTDALRKAIWNYNHAWWYVDQVMSIAEKYKEKY